jgi:hypothetical protein
MTRVLPKKYFFFIDSKSKPFTVVFNHRGEFVKENNSVITELVFKQWSLVKMLMNGICLI